MSLVIAIIGPTASGKTSFAIDLALQLNAEIFSADSRQFYSELNIGVARPTTKELSLVKHHFIANKSILELYSAGDYQRDLRASLAEYFKSNKVAIVVGGSGFYVQAALFGLDEFPEIPTQIREQLNLLFEKEGIEAIQYLLKEKDPISYNQISLSNPRRIIRALEVCLAANKPFSEFKQQQKESIPYQLKTLSLSIPREILYKRIEQRCDEMLGDGLLEEVEKLKPFKHLNACNTVGYKEFFDLEDGLYTSKDEAVIKFKQHTRNYAKRQITWLKKVENCMCLEYPYNLNKALEYIKN